MGPKLRKQVRHGAFGNAQPRAHLGPGESREFQIVRGTGLRSAELRAAQRRAIAARIGRPSRAPQLTPAPLARTSPSSTARPGEKC